MNANEMSPAENKTKEVEQYSFPKILLIWLAASAPMWVLGWIAYPIFSASLSPMDAGLLRLKLFSLGLIWQFVLSMFILYREEGNIQMETIARRFWLNSPVSPKTGQKSNRLWWLLIPFILLTAVIDLGIAPLINSVWTKLLPFLAEPEGYSFAALVAPDQIHRWVGAWNLLAFFVVSAVFNAFLGEEFLFHGVLLPKMKGSFGKWDWVANGVLFGLYHIHQVWDLPGDILYGLFVAFTGKQYRSNWFPIILHSSESVYLLFLVLGLVLGQA